MKTFALGILLAASVAFAGPTIQGETVQLGRIDAGTLPVPVIGGLAYDTITGLPLLSDGGTWSYLAPLNESLAPTNYFVETTGNDANTCFSSATTCTLPCAPCLTIAGAIGKIPKTLRHPATVLVGVGTFTGATISGFTFSHVPGVEGGRIAIVGTLATITAPNLASGISGNTAATYVEQSSSSNTYGTLTDATGGWTVGNLRGRIVEITAGTGLGQKRIICDNTATVITICGGWGGGNTFAFNQVLPIGTSGYTIRDWATTIGTGVQGSIGYPNYGINTAFRFGFMVQSSGDESSQAAAFHIIDGFKFTGSTIHRALFVAGSASLYAINNRFENAPILSQNIINQNSALLFYAYNYSLLTTIAQSTIFTFTRSPNTILFATDSAFDGGGRAINSSRGMSNIQRASFRGQLQSSIEMAYPTGNTIFRNQIDCQSLGGFGVDNGSTTTGFRDFGRGTNWYGANTISNCATAIAMKGNVALYAVENSQGSSITIANTGAGNTLGISVTGGAVVQVKSIDSIAGTTSELQVEGTNYSLAVLRALVPKRITELGTSASVFEN